MQFQNALAVVFTKLTNEFLTAEIKNKKSLDLPLVNQKYILAKPWE